MQCCPCSKQWPLHRGLHQPAQEADASHQLSPVSHQPSQSVVPQLRVCRQRYTGLPSIPVIFHSTSCFVAYAGVLLKIGTRLFIIAAQKCNLPITTEEMVSSPFNVQLLKQQV